MEIIKFDVIDSTQVYAKKIAQDGETEKIVCADIQTSGRGRIGNTWQSLSGGLWFSFITDISDFEQERINFFTLLLGVTVYQVCRKYYDVELKLKWPNDLLLKNKKVCGIICEKIENKIISGIGINTNINTSDLIECGTSFFKETGRELNNIELMNDIVETFYNNLKKFDKNEVISVYRSNMAYISEKKFVKTINKEVLIKGIDDDGALIIEQENRERKITFGEIM